MWKMCGKSNGKLWKTEQKKNCLLTFWSGFSHIVKQKIVNWLLFIEMNNSLELKSEQSNNLFGSYLYYVHAPINWL